MHIQRFVFKKGTPVARQGELIVEIRGWSEVRSCERLVPGVDENAPTFLIVCVRTDSHKDAVAVARDLRIIESVEYCDGPRV